MKKKRAAVIVLAAVMAGLCACGSGGGLNGEGFSQKYEAGKRAGFCQHTAGCGV